MNLEISVTKYQGALPHDKQSYIFNKEGGSIGRSADNTWTLKDSKNALSRVQALIIFQNNKFYLIDKSSNGCYLKHSSTLIGKENSQELTHNDILLMAEYELQVNYITPINTVDDTPFENTDWSTSQESDSSATPSPPVFSDGDPFDDIFRPKFKQHNDYKKPEVDSSIDADSPLDMPAIEKNASDYFSQVTPPSAVEEKKNNSKQGDEWLFQDQVIDKKEMPSNLADKHPKKQTDEASQYDIPKTTPENTFDIDDKSIGQTQIFGSKNQVSTEDEINPIFQQHNTTDNDLQKENINNNEEKQPTNIPPPKQTPSADEQEQPSLDHQQNELFKALFAGAGIDIEQHQTPPSKEQAFLIGTILREMLQGTMDLLRSRTEIKAHMRLGDGDKTMISVAHNNPLKFLPSVEHVMSQLMLAKNSNNPAYMPLTNAVKESFNDLKSHQFALNMSMQEALSSTIREYFSPLNLQRKLEKSNPISCKIPWQKNAKLWKLFAETYEDIEEQASETFQLVLEKKIADAYHANMEKLKQQ
jgi:type VI secretion system FHA domain protein